MAGHCDTTYTYIYIFIRALSITTHTALAIASPQLIRPCATRDPVPEYQSYSETSDLLRITVFTPLRIPFSAGEKYRETRHQSDNLLYQLDAGEAIPTSPSAHHHSKEDLPTWQSMLNRYPSVIVA